MYTTIKQSQLSYDELRKLLFSLGFFKTTSRRYRRFEKFVSKDEYIGIEVDMTENYMTLASYWTATLSDEQVKRYETDLLVELKRKGVKVA